MLSFNDYQRIIKQYEDAIEEIELKIRYRKIELVGPEKSSTNGEYFVTSACITISGYSTSAEETRREEILNNDRDLADLNITLETLKKELKYIKSRAEMPTYVYDIPKTENWPKEE